MVDEQTNPVLVQRACWCCWLHSEAEKLHAVHTAMTGEQTVATRHLPAFLPDRTCTGAWYNHTSTYDHRHPA